MKHIYRYISALSHAANPSSNTVKTFFLFGFMMMINFLYSSAQTTYNFSSGSTLVFDGYYYTQANVTISGVNYKLTHLGNGSFTNQASGGNGNTACLKKDGSGGDFLKIERNDGLPFQFYGMWLYTSSMYNPPYYQPPYYNIKYYDQNNAEIVAETFVSNTQTETITVSKNLKVNYVMVTLNAIMVLKLDDLIVGPAAASVPTVSTTSISMFTENSCNAAGNVTSDGGAAVVELGIVYNTTGTPTIADTKVISGSGTGTFTQTLNSLNSSTLYYTRAYATNSVGTSYGAPQSVTTAGAFTLAQTHYFNTGWITTTSQATPFTKYVEGWNITATATGGLVSVSRITSATGTNSVAEGVASARALSSTSVESLTSLAIKANNNSVFDLESFKFKYLTKVANTSFGTITVTGYKNGIAISGAVASLTGIAPATGTVYAYTIFDLTANNNFNNIDQFIITVSNPVSSARFNAIDIDVMKIAPPTTLPLVLNTFSGKLQGKQALLTWSTSQEQNLRNFDVEYSSNGRQFISIGTVGAAGNSNSTLHYIFTHLATVYGNNYYRLKMNDIDGRYTYSPVINIKMSDGEKEFSIYPNPVITDRFYMELEENTALPTIYNILSSDGKVLQSGLINTRRQEINVKQFENGHYFMRLSNGQSEKFVLQKY